MHTVETIYEVPLVLEEAGLGNYLVTRLGLEAGKPDLRDWQRLVGGSKRPKRSLPIAIVGKYVELHDAYHERGRGAAPRRPAPERRCGSEVGLVGAAGARGRRALAEAMSYGIVVPGGFGYRGVEGKISAADYARDMNVPYLGLCLGMQCATIAFARFVMGDAATRTAPSSCRTRRTR